MNATQNAAVERLKREAEEAKARAAVLHVAHIDVPPAIAAAVSAADWSADDKKLDGGRHPGELLAFAGVAPGRKVAELAPAAVTPPSSSPAPRADRQGVGAELEVSPRALRAEALDERLKKQAMKNVVRVDREFDDPLPPEAKDLDVGDRACSSTTTPCGWAPTGTR